MIYFSLVMLSIAAKSATGLRRAALRLRANTNALTAAPLQRGTALGAGQTRLYATTADATDASAVDFEIYAIPERAVDEAAIAHLVERHVRAHATYLAKRPVAAHTQAAFHEAAAFARRRGAPLVVDAGCGTGLSTITLAARFPEHTVIGVDRSEARLAKGGRVPANALLLRAELGSFWRLLSESDLDVQETFLLYPNPYPKPKHLKMRWAGHATLPTLLGACGSKLTVRASWRTYLDELRCACTRAAELGVTSDLGASAAGPYPVEDLRDPLTRFEAKYARANVPVYELVLGGS